MSNPKMPADHFTVILGSNTFENCPSVVTWEDKDVIVRFRDGKDLKLLVDCDIKDANNNTIAKVANNKLVYAKDSVVYLETDDGITIKDKSSGQTYLDFLQMAPRQVKINGLFYIKGNRIEATDAYLDINTNKFMDCVKRNCRFGVKLGPSGIMF